MEEITNTTEAKDELVLTQEIRRFLSEAAKWASFLAIMGFIGVGFMVLIAIFTGVFLNNFPMPDANKIPFNVAPFVTIFYLVTAVLYFFPVLYLYRFGAKMKESLANKDQEKLSVAFLNLKKQYKFIGILTIATIALYLLIFIISIIAGVMAM